MSKKRILSFLLAGVMTLGALTGCGGKPQQSETSDPQKDAVKKTQLNVASEMLSDTLDPAIGWDSWFIVRFGAGETLVKFGDDFSYQPWLAESWSVAEDQLTWTFKLREDVKFSNGVPMTATKVKESIERLYAMEDPANGGTGNPQGYCTYSSISADDESHTLTIVTETPTPDLPGCFAYPWTMIIDVEGSKDRDIKLEGPICTGPYAYDSYNQDHSVQLIRNEYYWDGDVPFETVNVMKVPEATMRTMALQDGSADMALSLPATDRAMLEDNDAFNISVVAGPRVGYALCNQNGVLANDTLRKAVMMAIDGQTIADVTTGGSYTYGYAVLASNQDYGYDTLTYDYGYDPAAAAAMLDEAGIKDTDGDGIRELDGKNIVLNYQCMPNRQMDLIAQAQAAQLEELGIHVELTMTKDMTDALTGNLFDLFGSGEMTTPTGDPAKYLKHWYSKSTENYSNYKNEEYDVVYEQLLEEFDTAARKELIIKLQQILLDDAATLVYGYYNFNMCSTSAITGAYNPSCDFYWVTPDVKPAA